MNKEGQNKEYKKYIDYMKKRIIIVETFFLSQNLLQIILMEHCDF